MSLILTDKGGKKHCLPFFGSNPWVQTFFENEGISEKGCVEIEDWGFSVHFGLGFQENPIYTLHLCFS